MFNEFVDAANVRPEQLKGQKIVVHYIDKTEVQAKDFRRVEKMFSALRALKTDARGKLILFFSGYDDTPEEIYEIKEIREYVKEMFDRWPEMFYFLTQEDIIYKVILACLVDVQMVSPERKQGIADYVFENAPITTVRFTLRISDKMKRIIRERLTAYGKSIGESEAVLEKWIDNLVDITKGPTSGVEEIYRVLENLDIFEEYHRFAVGYWKLFTEDKDRFTIIPEHKLIKFIKEQQPFIQTVLAREYLSINLVSKGRFTNVFFILDKAYGEICPACHSRAAIVFKKNLFSKVSDSVFVPSFENYAINKVLPTSDTFQRHFPVPINPQTDKWACPFCLNVYPFHYDSETGLRYEK